MIVQEAVTILGGFVLGYLIDAGWARMVRGVHLERSSRDEPFSESLGHCRRLRVDVKLGINAAEVCIDRIGA